MSGQKVEEDKLSIFGIIVIIWFVCGWFTMSSIVATLQQDHWDEYEEFIPFSWNDYLMIFVLGFVPWPIPVGFVLWDVFHGVDPQVKLAWKPW